MQFKDIIGQNEVKQRMREMFTSQRIPHAILLLGSEGSGALGLGIAFAQYVNCTGDKSNGDSCGCCPSCLKYSKFAHPDLHFVYPVIRKDDSTSSDTYASEWRDMLQKTPYFNLSQWTDFIGGSKQALISRNDAVSIHQKLFRKSFEAEYKVLLMWKPELMNDVASNRILKILEEPPAKTLFILVGESTSHILPTILSRTQRLIVPPIDAGSIKNYLEQNYNLDVADSERIAHMSNGNFINALQVINDSDTNKSNLDFFVQFMRCCYSRKVPDMMRISDQASKNYSREQIKNKLVYSQRMLRESFVMNMNVPSLNYMTPEEEAFCQKFSRFIHIDNVMQMSSLIDESIAHVEQNGNVRIIIMDLLLQLTVQLTKARPQ